MPLPVPSDLVNLLSLSLGDNPVRSTGPPEDQLPFGRFVQRLGTLPEEFRSSFYPHFNSLYVPSFVSVVIVTLDGFDGSQRSDARPTLLLSTLNEAMEDSGRSPTFARFVRLNPQETNNLYVSLSTAIARLPQSTSDEIILSFLAILGSLALSIAVYSPSTTTLPSLDPSSRSNLRPFLPRLKRLATTPNQTPVQEFGRAKVYALLDKLVRGDLDLPALVSEMTWEVESPWLTCEARASAERGLVSCVRCEEGRGDVGVQSLSRGPILLERAPEGRLEKAQAYVLHAELVRREQSIETRPRVGIALSLIDLGSGRDANAVSSRL